MKKIAVLGSTGSIGTQTLEIVRHNEDLQVSALAAGQNVSSMEEQIREFRPRLAVMWKNEAALELKERVADTDTKILSGMEGLLELATDSGTDVLVTAIVGMIGIKPTIAVTNTSVSESVASSKSPSMPLKTLVSVSATLSLSSRAASFFHITASLGRNSLICSSMLLTFCPAARALT